MTSRNCIFCEITQGKRPATIVHQTEKIIAFKDIRPQAPIHILVIPKEHIPTLNDLTPVHQDLIGKLFLVAKELAQQFGIAEQGYRTVFNCNRDAGQDVYHIHLHLLGGRQFYWPPG
jgi:histidine triad (HIT) family protein